MTLTSQLAKVLEVITLDSIFKQVVNQLDPKQFSMKRKSTCHALVFFLHTILAELDRGENYVRIFFADFSKGFDLVDHNVIMRELDFLGVNKYLSRWVGAFLTNRTQMVSISGMLSTSVRPNGGIPQGTKLAPLLFAILVNRLVRNWPNRIKYVDDTTIYESIPRCSPSYLPCIANEISDFASNRGMRLNPTKCREVIVNFLQFQPSSINGLQLMGSVVKRVSSYKMLGVYVSHDLTWSTHIEYVYDKANKQLHALRLLKRA